MSTREFWIRTSHKSKSQVNSQHMPVSNFSSVDWGNIDRVPWLRAQHKKSSDHRGTWTIDLWVTGQTPTTTELCALELKWYAWFGNISSLIVHGFFFLFNNIRNNSKCIYCNNSTFSKSFSNTRYHSSYYRHTIRTIFVKDNYFIRIESTIACFAIC